MSSKVACLPIAFFESVAAFSLLLQIQEILFYFVSFFVGVARQLKRHSSASLEPVCMPNVHGLLRFCCHRTQQDKCPLHKKLGTLLDLCVSSLRRGHANLLCRDQFYRMIPEGNPAIRASALHMSSHNEHMNEDRCVARQNSKLYLQIYKLTSRHTQTPPGQRPSLTQSGSLCRRHFGRAAKASAC